MKHIVRLSRRFEFDVDELTDALELARAEMEGEIETMDVKDLDYEIHFESISTTPGTDRIKPIKKRFRSVDYIDDHEEEVKA